MLRRPPSTTRTKSLFPLSTLLPYPHMLESRAVDTDLACGVVCGQDALFAVTEKTVRYLQIASLQANACAIGVRYTHVLKDDAVHSSRAAAQDQRCLALASSAVEEDRKSTRLNSSH